MTVYALGEGPSDAAEDLHPIEDALRMVAVEDHLDISEPASELSLHKGDIVYVLERDASGWYGGHKDGETVTGWFPGSKVEAYKGRHWHVPTTPLRSPDARPVATPLGGRGAPRRQPDDAHGPAEELGQVVAALESRVSHLERENDELKQEVTRKDRLIADLGDRNRAQPSRSSPNVVQRRVQDFEKRTSTPIPGQQHQVVQQQTPPPPQAPQQRAVSPFGRTPGGGRAPSPLVPARAAAPPPPGVARAGATRAPTPPPRTTSGPRPGPSVLAPRSPSRASPAAGARGVEPRSVGSVKHLIRFFAA